ncbi:MAG: enoyl-CoA hydratase/isomerase family protein [Alphaproteobacteria bacterium]|nr:enoyl-CoA hydratase/isomerase family protein [Alphaproteobacteria bacterium]
MSTLLTSITFADGNILASRRVPVTTIVINRTESLNVLDAKTARGLAGAFEMADADEEIRAIVVTGARGSFCRGADPQDLVTGGAYFPWAGEQGPLGVPLTKPVIAAVEGLACADGLGVALFCDMRIVDETAAFAASSRRWGVPIGDGTTVRLPRLIGQARALDMVLTGRPVAADEAVAIGLATRKVARGKTRVEAEKLALQLAEAPQDALLADRRSVYDGFALEVEQAIRHEVARARKAYGPEAIAGVTRFVRSGGINSRKTTA